MRKFVLSSALAIAACFAGVANADLITNGDFSNGLNDWTTINSGVTSDPTTVWMINGLDPYANNGFSSGPASRVLYQDFIVPLTGVSNATFRFDFFSENSNPLDSATVNHVQGGDFSGPNIFRIDIVDPLSPVFTTPYMFELFADPGGVVGSENAMVTQAFADSAALTTFLNAHAGRVLRLRIGVAESTFPWNTGVDNVVLGGTTVPEPTVVTLLAIAGGLAAVRRRRS